MFGPGILARYLAKIAHCAAISQYGVGGFEPFLPQLILSEQRDDDRLLPFVSNAPPLEVDGDHRLFLSRQRINRYEFITCQIQLFARAEMPTYGVLVGVLSGSPAPNWAIELSRP